MSPTHSGSNLGLGGAALGQAQASPEADEAGARTLEAAYRLGIRHVDTSPAYGQSERRLGIALRRNRFPDLTVSTKAGTHPDRKFRFAASDIRWSVTNSLNVLGLPSVDVAFIHDPPTLEPVLAPRGGFAALREMQREGLCRRVGLGVHSHAFHRQAIDAGVVDTILTYGDYNLVRRSGADLIRYAKERGITVFLGSPMMHGLLASSEEPVRIFERRRNLLNWYSERDIAVAQDWYEWCRERGVSLRHLNMQFVLRTSLADLVLTGARDTGELETNVDETRNPVPDDVWHAALERIKELDAGNRSVWSS